VCVCACVCLSLSLCAVRGSTYTTGMVRPCHRSSAPPLLLPPPLTETRSPARTMLPVPGSLTVTMRASCRRRLGAAPTGRRRTPPWSIRFTVACSVTAWVFSKKVTGKRGPSRGPPAVARAGALAAGVDGRPPARRLNGVRGGAVSSVGADDDAGGGGVRATAGAPSSPAPCCDAEATANAPPVPATSRWVLPSAAGHSASASVRRYGNACITSARHWAHAIAGAPLSSAAVSPSAAHGRAIVTS
jgi:hypothetical protein